MDRASSKSKSRTKAQRRSSRPIRILIAENDPDYAQIIAHILEDERFEVQTAGRGSEALSTVVKGRAEFAAVVLDVAMSPDPDLPSEVNRERSGLYVARQIRLARPQTRLIALSVSDDPVVRGWFTRYGSGFVTKDAGPEAVRANLLRFLRRALRRGGYKAKPRCFVVHGHDSQALQDLRSYLAGTLKFKDVVVLRDQPSLGRTIIEKFEQEAAKIDVVFVLLTPDDHGAAADDPDDLKRRARQNVVFELGYFLGRLQRASGSIILLHGGDLELPSDIAGVVYIDITAGIGSADREIRRELAGWL